MRRQHAASRLSSLLAACDALRRLQLGVLQFHPILPTSSHIVLTGTIILEMCWRFIYAHRCMVCGVSWSPESPPVLFPCRSVEQATGGSEPGIGCHIRDHEGEVIVHGCVECDTMGDAKGLSYWVRNLESIEAKQQTLMEYVQGRIETESDTPPLRCSTDAAVTARRHMRQSYLQRKPQVVKI